MWDAENQFRPDFGHHCFSVEKKNRQNLEITSKMSNKTETDWDAEYQDIVPHFGDSYGVVKHAITDDMLELEFERVEVNFVAFGSN